MTGEPRATTLWDELDAVLTAQHRLHEIDDADLRATRSADLLERLRTLTRQLVTQQEVPAGHTSIPLQR